MTTSLLELLVAAKNFLQEQIGDFLQEMLGFSDGLVTNSSGQLLLDPARDLNLDSTDSEGISLFQTQALKTKPAQNLHRTRSQTKADKAAKQVLNTSVTDNIIPAQRLRLRHGVYYS